MHRPLLAATAALLIASASSLAEVRDLGQPLTPELEATSIAAIVADPEAWVGKLVRIEGRVTGVCAHMGCWMDLRSPDDATLRVKVDDGVIVFPPDAVGAEAVAEGRVELLDLTREQYEARLRHLAQEAGEEPDLDAIGEGPYRVVRLRGLGARILGEEEAPSG